MSAPQNPFVDFLRQPTAENFLTARAHAVRSPAYAPYSDALGEVARTLKAGDVEAAQRMLSAAMPGCYMSPQAHLVAAAVAEHAGQADAAKMERVIATVCLEGIRTSGDGSEERPYLVTRTSDEYDLVAFLEKQPAGQRLRHIGGRSFDVISTTDGDALWFDVTDAYQHLAEAKS